MNPLYDEFSTLQTKFIPRSQIELKQEIAKGQFGKVFKGKVILDWLFVYLFIRLKDKTSVLKQKVTTKIRYKFFSTRLKGFSPLNANRDFWLRK